MTDPQSPRFWPLALVLIGASPILAAQFWYRIGLLAYVEIGPLRTLGLLGVLALIAATFGFATAWAAWLLVRRGVPGWLKGAAVTLLFAGLVLNFAAVGLSLVSWSPMLAPVSYKVGAALIALVAIIAFARYRPQEQELVLRCAGALGWGLMAIPLLASPWIVAAAVRHSDQLVGAIPPAQGDLRPDRPRFIVMITFDGLAANRTSIHNPTLDNTPALEAMARESTVFTRARSASDGTVVSLGTVLSGLSPSTLQPQLETKLGYVPYDAITGAAGHLKAAGYRSVFATMIVHPSALGMANEYEKGAFNARRFFSSEFHSPSFLPLAETFRFARSRMFGNMKESGEAGFVQSAFRAVPKTFLQASNLITESTEPTFLWMHVGAPHLPYSRVSEFKAGAKPVRVVTVEESQAANASKDAAAAHDIQQVYDDYVRYVDYELGSFAKVMKRQGIWDDAMVIVTSDHGESHRPGRIGHGGGPLFKDQSFIPLIIKQPGQDKTRRVDDFVGHVDLVPTILGQVYKQVPAGFPGTSLLTDPIPAGRTLFTYGWVAREDGKNPYPRSIAAYRDRFVLTTDFVDRHEALYEVTADPDEAIDVSAQFPAEAKALREAIQAERLKF